MRKIMRDIVFNLFFTRLERADIINGLFRRGMDNNLRVDLLDPKEKEINEDIKKRCYSFAVKLGEYK